MVGSMNDCADKINSGMSKSGISSMMPTISMHMPMPSGTSAMKMGGMMPSGSMSGSSMFMAPSPT